LDVVRGQPAQRRKPSDESESTSAEDNSLDSVLNQNFHFGHPGKASIAESRLRCNGLRTAFRLDPPIFAGAAFRSGLIKAFRAG
jgi:hypothetical protein